jgi:hypothetical protein
MRFIPKPETLNKIESSAPHAHARTSASEDGDISRVFRALFPLQREHEDYAHSYNKHNMEDESAMETEGRSSTAAEVVIVTRNASLTNPVLIVAIAQWPSATGLLSLLADALQRRLSRASSCLTCSGACRQTRPIPKAKPQSGVYRP